METNNIINGNVQSLDTTGTATTTTEQYGATDAALPATYSTYSAAGSGVLTDDMDPETRRIIEDIRKKVAEAEQEIKAQTLGVATAAQPTVTANGAAVSSYVDKSAGAAYLTAHSAEIFKNADGSAMTQDQITDLTGTQRAQAIINYVATTAMYATDTGENWSTVSQFSANGLRGDCEDIANFTASLMMGAGLTSDQVHLGITAGAIDPATGVQGTGHVSLILNIDGTGPKACDITAMTVTRGDASTANDVSTNINTLAAADPSKYEVIYSSDGVVQTDGKSHTFGNAAGNETTAYTSTTIPNAYTIAPTTLAPNPPAWADLTSTQANNLSASDIIDLTQDDITAITLESVEAIVQGKWDTLKAIEKKSTVAAAHFNVTLPYTETLLATLTATPYSDYCTATKSGDTIVISNKAGVEVKLASYGGVTLTYTEGGTTAAGWTETKLTADKDGNPIYSKTTSLSAFGLFLSSDETTTKYNSGNKKMSETVTHKDSAGTAPTKKIFTAADQTIGLVVDSASILLTNGLYYEDCGKGTEGWANCFTNIKRHNITDIAYSIEGTVGMSNGSTARQRTKMENIDRNGGALINGITAAIKKIGEVIADNPDALSDAGMLAQVQAQLQIYKDGLATITAIIKMANDTKSDNLKTFTKDMK